MEIKDFIGKVVVNTKTKTRYILTEITAPEICAKAVKVNSSGYLSHYCWETINGDPFTNGDLIFEEEALNEPFKKMFDAYSRTEDARWERYGYYLMK